jgi:hypothetical protein
MVCTAIFCVRRDTPRPFSSTRRTACRPGARLPLAHPTCQSSTLPRRSMCKYHSPWLQHEPRDISHARFQRAHSAVVQVVGPGNGAAAGGPEEDAAPLASSAQSLASARARACVCTRRKQTHRQLKKSTPTIPAYIARTNFTLSTILLRLFAPRRISRSSTAFALRCCRSGRLSLRGTSAEGVPAPQPRPCSHR